MQMGENGAYAYPVTGSLGDVLTDLLGRETKRTDLRRKSGRGTDLTTSGAEVAIFPASSASSVLFGARVAISVGRKCYRVAVWFQSSSSS